MADRKLPLRLDAHQCPVCNFPQTRIRRKLSDEKHGATNYVCTRKECMLGIDLAKVETWVAV